MLFDVVCLGREVALFRRSLLSPSSSEICAVERFDNMLNDELFRSQICFPAVCISLIFVRSEIRIHAMRLDNPAENFVFVSLR